MCRLAQISQLPLPELGTGWMDPKQDLCCQEAGKGAGRATTDVTLERTKPLLLADRGGRGLEWRWEGCAQALTVNWGRDRTGTHVRPLLEQFHTIIFRQPWKVQEWTEPGDQGPAPY